MVTLKSPKPRYLWLSRGSPSVFRDLGPLLGAVKSRRAKLEEQKMLAFGRGFFVRCVRPKGLRAPWNPQRQGCPCTARLISASGDPAGAFSPRGRGAGEERPRHPAGRLGSLRSRQGAVSSPLRGCGPHQPLDPPFTEKRARGPRRGLEGHCRSGWGQGSRSDTAQRLGLDAQERPQRSPGWWLGVLFPQPPATWRTPRRPPEALLPLIFASEVWGFGGRHAP